MDHLSPFLSAIHSLAAVIWVGGMFFAYVILRPALGLMDAQIRLKTWDGCFRRFFNWVWIAVIVLPASGYVQVFGISGGFENAGAHVTLMHWIGLAMIGLFAFLYFAPYRAYARAAAADDWAAAGARLPTIRRIVGTNLILGLLNVVVGASGRFWIW